MGAAGEYLGIVDVGGAAPGEGGASIICTLSSKDILRLDFWSVPDFFNVEIAELWAPFTDDIVDLFEGQGGGSRVTVCWSLGGKGFDWTFGLVTGDTW